MKCSLLAPLVILLVCFGAFAQGTLPPQASGPTMTLTGAVYDINGAVIVNGAEVVTRGPGGKVYEANVNDEGFYTLRLPLGVYLVEVSAPGFCPSGRPVSGSLTRHTAKCL